MLDRIDFLLGEAFASLRRNIWMTFAAISTSAMALFLLGGLVLAYIGVRSLTAHVPDKFVMNAFMKTDATMKDVSQAAQAIRAIPFVKKLIWISKEAAWAQQRRDLGAAITEGIENPLAHAFKVTLTDIKHADDVAEGIRKVEGIDADTVSYLGSEQQFLSDALEVTRVLGLGAGGLMLLTSGVLIYNAIRLTVLARKRELRIMSLVGATRLTVILPLLIEGSIQGLLGGAVSTLLLWSTHLRIKTWIEGFSAMWHVPAIPIFSTLMALMGVGAAYGFICSMLAAREHLRVA